jgi:hypothetical protein
MFQQMVSWVETGQAPDTVVSSNATLGSRPMCPYPQTAIYNGNGADPKLLTSWHCGGDIETRTNACMDRVARYQDETGKHLEAPQECSASNDHAHN